MQAERFRVGSRGSTVSGRSGLVGECLPGEWRNKRRRAALFGLVSGAAKQTDSMMTDFCKALPDMGKLYFQKIVSKPHSIPDTKTTAPEAKRMLCSRKRTVASREEAPASSLHYYFVSRIAPLNASQKQCRAYCTQQNLLNPCLKFLPSFFQKASRIPQT